MSWETQLGKAALTDNVGLAGQCFVHVDPHSITGAEAVLTAAEHGSLVVLRLCLLEGADPEGYDYEEGPDHEAGKVLSAFSW